MDLSQNQITIGLIALCIILLGIKATLNLYHRGRLLTLVGGLHVNAIIVMGIGPMFYILYEPADERVPYDEQLQALVTPFFYFLMGYVLWHGLEYWLRQSSRRRLTDIEDRGEDTLNAAAIGSGTVVLFAVLAAAGYYFSQFEFATSGIGTIFPVLQYLFYPTIIMAILLHNWRLVSSYLLTFSVVGLASVLTLFSAWRSQFIMTLLCVGMGIMFRSRRGGLWLAGAAIVLFYILLPFQDLKRRSYEIVSENIVSAFVGSQDISWPDRQQLVGNFIATRINGARELAYIQAALERGDIELRHGLTYEEAVIQLVPRLFWPDKPSYNETTNFLLPRQIGLLGSYDLYTSWAVNIWAEAVWNFSYYVLIIFVPLVFYSASYLDRLVKKLIPQHVNYWVLKTTFFFIAFQLVTVINVMTYIIWLVIIVYFINATVLANRVSSVSPGAAMVA